MAESKTFEPVTLPSSGTGSRLSIYKQDGDERIQLGVVSLRQNADESWALHYPSNSTTSSTILPVLEAYAARRRCLQSTGKPSLQEVVSLFEDYGYTAEFIPEADHQIQFQIDLDTGALVGTGSSLHPLADKTASVRQQLFEAIGQTFAEADSQLAAELNSLLDANQPDAAVAAVKVAHERGLFSFGRSAPLLAALVRIDVSAISQNDSRLIRECRVVTAHKLHQYAVIETDAAALLAECTNDADPKRVVALKTARALGEIQNGKVETGLSTFRELENEFKDMAAEGRAWTSRNIARSLLRSEKFQAKAIEHAERSAGYFLEAGIKSEAAKSLALLADLLVNIDPRRAVGVLAEMMGHLEATDAKGRRDRAGGLHFRSQLLVRLGQHEVAAKDAREASELLRGLLGAESLLVSVLYLAAQETRHFDADAAQSLDNEADALAAQLKQPRFRLSRRIAKLGETFDTAEVLAVQQEAQAAGEKEVVWGMEEMRAVLDKSLTTSARLEMLENVLASMSSANAREEIQASVKMAIADVLARDGQLDRAEQWYRQVLSFNAFDMPALTGLLKCLEDQGKWSDSIQVLQHQVTLKGPLPGLMFFLGKSRFKAGHLSDAVRTLRKVIDTPGCADTLKENAQKLETEALRGLITPILPEPPAPVVAAITRSELGAALRDFSASISGSQRMKFWRSNGKRGHRWVSCPEGLAQALLHQHLISRFPGRIEIFEEAVSGAGYVDLYLILEGNLRVVVELKMCGGTKPGSTYASTWAISGRDQITHYMDHRKSNLGYLLVIDGRQRDCGKTLPGSSPGRHTVEEIIIQVKPNVSTPRDA